MKKNVQKRFKGQDWLKIVYDIKVVFLRFPDQDDLIKYRRCGSDTWMFLITPLL